MTVAIPTARNTKAYGPVKPAMVMIRIGDAWRMQQRATKVAHFSNKADILSQLRSSEITCV
jgi:hypothetical protein